MRDRKRSKAVSLQAIVGWETATIFQLYVQLNRELMAVIFAVVFLYTGCT